MTGFFIKMIALVTMTVDHIAGVFGWEGWNVLPFNADFLRYIGRVSYPIFAFCIVSGWKYTHNREKYFSRLALCAVVSQIPFSLAFYKGNIGAAYSENSLFGISGLLLPAALFAIISYWYFGLNRRLSLSLILVGVAAILPTFMLKIKGVWILAPDFLNVLYTFLIGMVLLFLIEKIKEKQLNIIEYVWLFTLCVMLLLAYGRHADYGNALMGVILIAALYFAQKSKILQCSVVVIWGIVFYAVINQNWSNAIATVFPAMLILLYNGKKGSNSAPAKWIFYIFYPLHLLCIGVISHWVRCFWIGT